MKALKPSIMLLSKLGSAIFHAEEAIGENAHAFDVDSFIRLIEDKEVTSWLEEMGKAGLLPEKR